MENNKSEIEKLRIQVEELKEQLYESRSIIEAIQEGSLDALVFEKDGRPELYSIESADFTYRLLIEKFGEGALSIGYDGLILYNNDYFSRLTNLPTASVTGEFFNTFFDKPFNYKTLKNKLASGNFRTEAFIKLNSKKIPVSLSFTDLQPSVPAIGIIVTDLTQKRKTEEALLKYQSQLEKKVTELDASNTSLSQFIHVIAHDLKEPIRKLLAYTSRLNTDVDSTYSQSELNHIAIIKASGSRLNSLVDDIVKYSFISNKDAEEDVNLNEVLGDALDDLEIIIKETGTIITPDVLPTVKGSYTQLQQVFLNLITNAVKYAREGVSPEIKILYSLTETSFNTKKSVFHKISFYDNGIGMDNQYINKIFTIFQRLHLRTQYSGNGIGLAICKKVMDNHSGHIDVTSTPGKGSIFTIYLKK